MSSHELTLGQKAAQKASEVASKWLDDAWGVIEKRVNDTASRGLFRCKLQFTDVIPQDKVNQVRLLKLLEREELQGTWTPFKGDPEKNEEDGVTLTIMWS